MLSDYRELLYNLVLSHPSDRLAVGFSIEAMHLSLKVFSNTYKAEDAGPSVLAHGLLEKRRS